MKYRIVKWIGGLVIVAAVFGAGWMLNQQPEVSAPPTQAAVPAAVKQLWTCSMHPQVIRDEPGKCPICHMKLVPVKSSKPADPPASAPAPQRKIKYWWDPMLGPSSIRSHPGKSAMGMDLVPVYESGTTAPAGELVIDPAVVQNMGITLATVKHGTLTQTIRAAGYLMAAQPRQYDVNLRISGWIQRLYANTTGMSLKKGQKLFDLYSPQLTVAVGELISARQGGAASQALYQSARRKLLLWDIPEAQVDQLAQLKEPPGVITFGSPADGILTETDVVEGSAVNAGQRVMRIVDESTLWLEAQVFPRDVPLIHLGQSVQADVQGMPGTTYGGKVTFISPQVDAMTRTTQVRMELKNEDLTLRPGMYATVLISSQSGDHVLLAPRSAVIDTGVRQVAFVAKGNGRFEPRQVKLGLVGSDDMVQVLSGLEQGDKVVVSGQFLLDADSRMQEAIRRFLEK